ncbi:hypothetical protein [Corynebacterium nuruki]|nr:hypothetical protein [Corynebacterium nuruki]
MAENRTTVSGTIYIYRSALRHFITGEEIRATIAFPRLVYSLVSRISDSALIYRYVGGREGGPWIEVLADIRSNGIHVFHAMLLTRSTALEAEAASGRSVSFVEDVVAQRKSFPGAVNDTDGQE